MTKIRVRGRGEVHKDRRIATRMEKAYTDAWCRAHPDPGVKARKHDPDTSHHAVPDKKKLNRLQRLFYRTVCDEGDYGATTAEVVEITGESTNNMNSRAVELRRAGLIVIA